MLGRGKGQVHLSLLWDENSDRTLNFPATLTSISVISTILMLKLDKSNILIKTPNLSLGHILYSFSPKFLFSEKLRWWGGGGKACWIVPQHFLSGAFWTFPFAPEIPSSPFPTFLSARAELHGFTPFPFRFQLGLAHGESRGREKRSRHSCPWLFPSEVALVGCVSPCSSHSGLLQIIPPFQVLIITHRVSPHPPKSPCCCF